MTNKEKIDAVTTLLNEIIVGVDTPTRVVTYCRRFRAALARWRGEIEAEQTEINFSLSADGEHKDE